MGWLAPLSPKKGAPQRIRVIDNRARSGPQLRVFRRRRFPPERAGFPSFTLSDRRDHDGNTVSGTVSRNRLEVGRAVTWHFWMTKRSPFRFFKTNPDVIRLAWRLRSCSTGMKVIGNADRRETGRWKIAGLRIYIFRSGGGTVRCSASGRCGVCKHSPPFMLPSAATSTRKATTTQVTISSPAAPQL